MPGLMLWQHRASGDIGPDMTPLEKIAVSQQIYRGDPCVWTTVTGSENRVRLAVAQDITDLWAHSGAAGIFGFAPYDIGTDANGNFTTSTSPVSLAGNVAPIYNVPTMAGFQPVDPSSGFTRANLWTCKNIIGGMLWETTAVTASLIGTAVGLYISTIGNAATWFWSTAATTKIARIVGFDSQNKMYNTTATTNVLNTTHYARCPVGVLMYTTYDQYYTTNNAYAD